MNYSEIRKRAREALNGNWGMAVIATLIASIFGADGNSAGAGSLNLELEESNLEFLESTDLNMLIANFDTYVEEHLAEILAVIGVFSLMGMIIAILLFCLGSIIRIGYQKFNLDIVDSTPLNIGTLFSYFKHWKNAILTNLLQAVYIFLWSLLCIIPGIIAQYNYAMTPYILAENPELSPNEALQRSKEMMHGHRMELFLLNLSFIGWTILAVLTCGIGFIWLVPYINATNAEFYREISGTKCSYQYNII